MSTSAEQPQAPLTPLQYFDSGAASYEEYVGGCTAEVIEKALSFLSEITPNSVILDNACGTGLVTDVLLRSPNIAGLSPKIHAVDGAPNMVEIARNRFSSHENIRLAVTPGEDLSLFEDETFSHSLTNMGLFFFADASKGAREIFRTLAPGGTAIVTGWSDLGYLQPIHAMQKLIRPEDKLFEVPFPVEWLNPQHMKEVLSGAGLKVEIQEVTAHRAADNLNDLGNNMMKWLSASFFREWSEEEVKKGEEIFRNELISATEEFTRLDGEKLVGIKMKAYVAVCKK